MRRLLLLNLVLLLATQPAHGFGGLFRRPAVVYYPSTAFYPTPVLVRPAPVMVGPPIVVSPAPTPAYPPVVVSPPVSVPVAPPAVFTPPPLAVPQVAPPSLTPEPPEMPPASGASTSLRPGQRYFDLFPVSGPSNGDRFSVAFWNLTKQALTLQVEGRTHVLTAGKSVTLDLPRSFRWQVDGRDAEAVHLASSDGGAEVLIRR